MLESTPAFVKRQDVNSAVCEWGAVPEGSQGVRVILNLLECNAVLALENSQRLVTIVSHIAMAEEAVACGGRLPMQGIACKCARRRLTKPPSTEGGVTHISSKLLNS